MYIGLYKCGVCFVLVFGYCMDKMLSYVVCKFVDILRIVNIWVWSY